jgi:hypothetical protein
MEWPVTGLNKCESNILSHVTDGNCSALGIAATGLILGSVNGCLSVTSRVACMLFVHTDQLQHRQQYVAQAELTNVHAAPAITIVWSIP